MPKKSKEWYENPKFLKERKKWYAKLAKAGFEDVEFTDWETGESGNLLRGYSVAQGVRYGADKLSAAQEHFYQAGHWLTHLENQDKPDPLTLKAWAMYADGFSISKIAKALGKSRGTISKIIQREIGAMRAAIAQDPHTN